MSATKANDNHKHPIMSAYACLWALEQLLMAGLFDAAAVLVRSFIGEKTATAGSDNLAASASTSLQSYMDFLSPLGCIAWLVLLILLLLMGIMPRHNAATASASVWLLSIGHVCAMIMHWRKLPFIWDYELWDAMYELCIILTALTPLFSFLFRKSRRSNPAKQEWDPDWLVYKSAASLKMCIVLLYGCTVFWKLTTSFFGPQSCGTIFTLSLLDAYTPSSFDTHVSPVAERLVWFTAIIAPYLTVVVEAAIPLLLWLTPWPIGIVFGSIFHVLIAITPPPNNASIFSVGCIIKFWVFAADDVFLGIQKPLTSPTTSVVAAFSVAVTAAAIRLGVAHGGDWGCPLSVALTCYYLFAYVSKTTPPADGGKVSKDGGAAIVYVVVTIVTLIYGMVLPILGLQDMGATTMFANLYVFSGTNHLLGTPTGILFNYMPELAGGVVRVDYTSSDHMNNIHPNEKSTKHSQRLKKWLLEYGHTARQFGPYGARVLVGRRKAPASRPAAADLPADEAFFTPYLIPMIELRRLVNDALVLDHSFNLSTFAIDHR